MKNRLGQFLIVAVVCAFMAAGTALAADTIKLGVAGPHSGDLASYGIPTVKAAELVVKDINAKGGVLGRQVELLVEDDVCKPEIATNTATKLVSEGVHVVLGHICSGATKAALGIYKDSSIPVMSPSATNPALTQSGDYPNFFRTIASDDAQARLEVDFALDVLKLKKLPFCTTRATTARAWLSLPRPSLKKIPVPKWSSMKASPPVPWITVPSCRRSRKAAPRRSFSAAIIPKPPKSLPKCAKREWIPSSSPMTA
jgi:hypothetical protein